MDPETFAARTEAVKARLYRTAYLYLGSEADALEAVDEAVYQALRALRKLRQPEFFETWLTRILINECKTLLRKRKRQLPTADLPNLAAPPPDEQAMALRTALFALPEKYRVPLVLNLLEGYTLREIAAMLSLPVGTVKTRIARAKQKLEQEVSVHA